MESFKSLILKSVSCAIVLISLSFNSYSQIDSVNVAITFTSEIDSVTPDSLGNYSLVDVININTSIYDIDFMGEVIVTIYDGATDFPISKVKMTAQDFIDQNLKVGSTVTTKLFGGNVAGSYRIETLVRNFQGADLPVVITNHNI